MTGINTQFSINLWILAILFLPIKRQTSRLDQKSGDNSGLERWMLTRFPSCVGPGFAFLDFHVSYRTSAELRKQEWILEREGEEILMDEKIAVHKIWRWRGGILGVKGLCCCCCFMTHFIFSMLKQSNKNRSSHCFLSTTSNLLHTLLSFYEGDLVTSSRRWTFGQGWDSKMRRRRDKGRMKTLREAYYFLS